MRKLAFISLILSLGSLSALAQTAYINSQTILERIPEYATAQDQIERMKSQYEAQIEQEVKSIETLFNQYQAEKSRLSDAQRQMRENDIISRERKVKERQTEIFGQDGEMAIYSMDLLSPLMNRLKDAIDAVSREMDIVMVFDISVTQGVVYSDPKGDITNIVMARMNIK